MISRKKIRILALASVLIFMLCGCDYVSDILGALDSSSQSTDSDSSPSNRPPDFTDPAAPPHEGIFACEAGELIFGGEGGTVTVALSEGYTDILGGAPNNTEYKYLFYKRYYGDSASADIHFKLTHEAAGTAIYFSTDAGTMANYINLTESQIILEPFDIDVNGADIANMEEIIAAWGKRVFIKQK